ncbi:MAG: hypothetical protein AAF560_06050 [Acidobacteriota bacterium]
MDPPFTISFEAFWEWVITHPNCILRAGTPEAVLYDDDDLHWTFGTEGSTTLLVQVLRGKRLMGELVLDSEQTTYVQAVQGQRDDEYLFELITETEKDRVVGYFFVLAHGYEEEPSSDSDPVH